MVEFRSFKVLCIEKPWVVFPLYLVADSNGNAIITPDQNDPKDHEQCHVGVRAIVAELCAKQIDSAPFLCLLPYRRFAPRLRHDP